MVIYINLTCMWCECIYCHLWLPHSRSVSWMHSEAASSLCLCSGSVMFSSMRCFSFSSFRSSTVWYPLSIRDEACSCRYKPDWPEKTAAFQHRTSISIWLLIRDEERSFTNQTRQTELTWLFFFLPNVSVSTQTLTESIWQVYQCSTSCLTTSDIWKTKSAKNTQHWCCLEWLHRLTSAHLLIKMKTVATVLTFQAQQRLTDNNKPWNRYNQI